MAHPVKVATPATSATVNVEVQLSTPADGLVPMASVTLRPLSLATTLPPESSTLTAIVWGPAAGAFSGPVVKASLLGGPVMLKGAETAVVSDGAVATSV